MKPKILLKKDLDSVFEYTNNILYRKLKNGTNKIVLNRKNKKDGYCAVKFNKRSIYYHTIVYILYYGFIEIDKRVDHIDGNKINNNISNLRSVTVRENQQNQYTHRLGRLPGTTYSKAHRKWASRAKVNGVKKFIGYYETEKDANRAYLEFIKTL